MAWPKLCHAAIWNAWLRTVSRCEVSELGLSDDRLLASNRHVASNFNSRTILDDRGLGDQAPPSGHARMGGACVAPVVWLAHTSGIAPDVQAIPSR